MSKELKNFTGIVVVILCFSAEIDIIKNYQDQIDRISLTLALVTFFVWFFLYLLNKTELLFVSIFNAFKAGLSSILGLFLVLHTIIHTDLITSYISEYINNGKSFYPALLSVSFFCLPFFILSLISKKEKIKYRDPEILISSLSLNKRDVIQKFIDNNFNESILNDAVNRRFWNWLPLIKVLRKYSSIKKVFLLVSKDVKKEFEGLQNRSEIGFEIYKRVLAEKVLTANNVELEIVEVINPSNYDEYKVNLEKKLYTVFNHKKNLDDVLLFDLTSGTAISTIVMLIFAFKGNRRAIYQRQEENFDLEIIQPDVQTLRELWQQILENL